MKRFIFIALCAMSSSHLEARTWRVSVDGMGDAPTIQAAIDSAAAQGDLVLVDPGTYYENIDFLGKEIWLKSTAGPAVTTIDGSQEENPVILIISEAGVTPTIDGFSITGGTGIAASCDDFGLSPTPAFGSGAGGGLFIYGGSPVIRRNVFHHNFAEGFGGAVVAAGCGQSNGTITIEDNLFFQNRSGLNGGGLGYNGGGFDLILRRNVFKENVTDVGDGGAVWILTSRAEGGGGTATITHNQFWENEANDHGGAIELSINHTPVVVEYNLFVRNRASGLDGPSNWGSGGAISMRPAYGSVQFNTFVGNQGGVGGRSGGSVLLHFTSPEPLELSNNIIAGSESSAIRCAGIEVIDSGVRIEDNLFWENEDGDLEDSASCFPNDWADHNLFADPQFCGPEADNFTVSKDSPALTNGASIGAFWDPGCGAGVPVQQTTWGGIKARFFTEP